MTTRTRHIALRRLALFVAAPMLAWAQDVPVGPEFQVNSYTTAHQNRPDVSRAETAFGTFTIVWEGYGASDPNGYGVFARRFLPDGTPDSPDFAVGSGSTTEYERRPAIAASGAIGNFVVVWEDYQDGEDGGISGRLFTNNLPGAPFVVNTYTTGAQYEPDVAQNAAGDFIVVWDGYKDGVGGVFGQRFDSSGSQSGTEFQVNEFTTANAYGDAAVAKTMGGGFVVVWEGNDGDDFGIFARRFDFTGFGPEGSEILVNTYTTDRQHEPDVAIDDAGNFVVVWEGTGPSGYGEVFARRFDSAGVPLDATQFQVNGPSDPGETQYDPTVTVDDVGNFVVAWSGYDDDSYGVVARRFDAGGTPLGGDFQVNTYTVDDQMHPKLARGVGPGAFVATWDGSHDHDGSEDGVFAQRFRPGSYLKGKRCTVKDSGTERSIICSATEVGSPDPAPPSPFVVTNPSLRIQTRGTTPSVQSFLLPALWTPLGSLGWKFLDRDGLVGPVTKVLIKRSNTGKFTMKTKIKGTSTTPAPGVSIVPPNVGTDVSLVLELGDEAYCVGLGPGQGGGTIVANDDRRFTVVNPTGEGTCLP